MTLTSSLAKVTATPVTPNIGAVIDGIDLTDSSPDNIAAIYQLLLEHGVLFFRNSMLEPEQHKALAKGFGKPSIFPLFELLVKPGSEPEFLTDIVDAHDDPPKADIWHTDVTWVAKPPKLAILQAVDVPASGGDTLWADLHAAYETLSPPMQDFFDGLVVTHRVSEVILDAARRGGEKLASMLLEKFPPVQHPLVRTHPETGRKTLFVADEFMIAIDGMHEDESQMWLDWLRDYINNPNFHVRWSWNQGDLAIWDERRTNHRALSNHYPSYRHMRRCTVAGDKPYFKD